MHIALAGTPGFWWDLFLDLDNQPNAQKNLKKKRGEISPSLRSHLWPWGRLTPRGLVDEDVRTSTFRTFPPPAFGGAKWKAKMGRNVQVCAWWSGGVAAAQAWPGWLEPHVINNGSGPPRAPLPRRWRQWCAVFFLRDVCCRSVIYSCSLCRASQQVLNATVTTCFQNQTRNKSFTVRKGNNQPGQTEELSRKWRIPPLASFLDGNAAAQRQHWMINMKINTEKKKITKKRCGFTDKPAEAANCRTSNTRDVPLECLSTCLSVCLSYRGSALTDERSAGERGRRGGGGQLFLGDRLLRRQ